MRSLAESSPSKLPPLPPEFYADDSSTVASKLLGKALCVRHGRRWLVARIVETEAYHEADPASHSFVGVTGRTWPMFEAGGTSYVYLSYGINWCLNVVTGPKGRGEAVLLRAAEPLVGEETMRANRRGNRNLLNGPGRLTQALGIGPQYNGLTFFREDLKLVDVSSLFASNTVGSGDIVTSPRIGITKARDELLRFYLRGSLHVSKGRK